MENIITAEKNETLFLTKQVFNILLVKIIDHFMRSHEIKGRYKDSQLYGFGNYDPEKPNLKNDLELVVRGYVNGKYLYNKYREAATGKPIIKISREYKTLFFYYLGYKNINEFIESDFFTIKQKNKQLELISRDNKLEDYFYACYYFGEDNRMNKARVIIYNGWKTIEMTYIYMDKNEEKGVYSFYGTISQSEDFAYFDTKYYVGSKKSQGAKFIFFIGKSSPRERDFLIGTYSGFDKYDNTIAGKMILKKFDTRNEMETEVSNKYFDPIICQELIKKRIVVESIIKKNPLTFSKKSPFAQVLLKSAGDYIFKFKTEKNIHELKLKIEKDHYNIVSLDDFIMLEGDLITVLNKGQILNFDFSISGMFYLQKTSIYIKAIDFIEHKKEVKGVFNGVDINNKIISGEVIVELI